MNVRLLTCLAFLLAICASTRAQTISIVQGDTIFICEPGFVTLNAVYQGADSSNLHTSTALSTVDDTHSGVVNIGFPFVFYGNTYTQCVLSTNNYITFDLSNADQYSAWPINSPLPSPGYPANNAIFGPWQDTYPGALNAPQPGWVSYTTIGDAPNRVFIFNMCMVPMYSCVTQFYSGQIKLFEGSNHIEFHITQKEVCATWNQGQAIMGLQNENGTLFDVVNGYDAGVQWTATSEAWLLTPNGPDDYDWQPTTYDPVQVYTTDQLQWFWGNQDPVYSDSVVLWVDETGWAKVEFFGCFGTQMVSGGADSVLIIIGDPATVISQRVSACNDSTHNALYAHFLPTETAPFSLTWSSAAGAVLQTAANEYEADSLTNIPAGTYHLEVINAVGCTLNYTFDVPANEIEADFTWQPDLICQFTPVTFTATIAGSVTGYQWQFGDGITSSELNPEHVFGFGADSLPVYFTVYNDTFASCTQTDTAFLTIHPNIVADYIIPEQLCVGEIIQLLDASQPFPVAWQWHVGDSMVSTNPDYAFQTNAVGTLPIALVVTDSLCGTDSVFGSISIHEYPVVFIGNDTLLCPGESITLDAQNPGATYQWSTGHTTQAITLQLEQTLPVSVTVTNVGCSATDEIIISMNCSLIFPNAFSPNRDGHNDVFLPHLVNMETYRMRIYNRWGELVYAVDSGNGSLAEGWDGTHKSQPAPIGVYVYYATGTTIRGNEIQVQGNFVLLR